MAWDEPCEPLAKAGVQFRKFIILAPNLKLFKEYNLTIIQNLIRKMLDYYLNNVTLHPSLGTTEWQLVSYTVFEDWLIARGYLLTVDSS